MYAPGTSTGLPNPPSQGYLIQSTACAPIIPNSNPPACAPGASTRTLRVSQGYPKLPTEFFPYTLFIPTGK